MVLAHVLIIQILVCLQLIEANKKNLVPNTYVIEFDNPIHSFPSKRHVHSKRSVFYQQLNAYNIRYDIRHEYELINAVSISFKTPQDSLLFFEKALGVKKAWPVNTITKPKINQETDVDKRHVSTLFNFYDRTGINRIRQELGMTGRGVKVGIIDTGVDYTHPALGGCFGPNCRVAYGYDFVGDEYTGENSPIPDEDPRDSCNGHGTHVTGIIGANDVKLNFTGVAPEVTFGAYRIFGCAGSSTDDIIMRAMEKAYLDGMDVINLSLGDIGWPESPASLLADELALKGMIVCAAAGNEGEKGIFQVGAPSLGKHALSVASVDNSHVLSHTIKLGNGLTLGYATANGNLFNVTNAEIMSVADEFLQEHDGCEEIEMDVEGKVVLFSRGGCMFSEKVLNAEKAGAAGVLIYNNKPGLVNPSIAEGLVQISYGGLSKEDGYILFKYLSENPKKSKAEFLRQDVSFPVPTAGTISSFSSWGLGPDLSLKPDISAPGGQIYSTFPVSLGSYATLSGTSMASPYVAGMVALMQQSRGGNRAIDVKEIRSMLINNGHPVNVYESDQLESVARQGSGLVNVYQAIKSDTIIEPEQIHLYDVEHGAENHEYVLTIRNNGRLAADYTINHISASTAQGFSGHIPLMKPVMMVKHEVEANVNIYDSVVSIGANEEKKIVIRIAPPSNSDQIAPSIYSGYIVIKKNEHDVKYVPYAGLTTSLSKLPVLIVNNTMPQIQNSKADLISPAILSFQLAEPTRLLKIMATHAKNTTENYGLIPGGYSMFVGRNSIHDPNDIMVIPWSGHVVSRPEQATLGPFMHQNKINQDMKVKAAVSQNIGDIGTQLPKGTYKLKMMALRPFGNMDNEADYDVWISPEIQVG